MRQNAIESLVSGIKQLNALLVVMVPDCLLFSAWQRAGQTWDAETAGAFLGELMHSTEQGTHAISGWSGGPACITLESEAGLIIVRQVGEPFIVAYVFDKGTAIGWARLQIQRTLDDVERAIQEEEKNGVRAAVASPQAAPAWKAQNTAPRPAPPPAARPAQPAAPQPAAPQPAAPRPAPAPAARPAQPAAPKPAPAPAAARPAAAASTPAKPMPSPTPVTRVTPPSAAPQATENKTTTGAAPQPASTAPGHDPTPKGTRLIKYLDAHAPDTHAALLRVSLQTGLPLTLLRMPDSLSDDEFAQVEESVRRILGVDQLNF
jgi:predicted regulator of Ras-like GTPase activity (Roadblock/LC7/MglB family)